MTMLILTAMGPGNLDDKRRESRERAVRWLNQTPVRGQSQPLVLRTLVAAQNGDKDAVLRNVQQLRSLQQEDGGWSQIAGLSTDALATGQALYAFGAAGIPSSDAAISRAWRFLLSTQRDDGSWLVHTRNPNSHDPIISFYGTGWATLGLIRTLPPPVAAGR
jgi:Squalene-hopene cyclase C-terminal domain